VRPQVAGDCPGWCIDAGGGLTIEHSTFQDIGGTALNFYNGGGGTIRDSSFIGNGAGIVVDLDGRVLMERNLFVGNRSGISLNTHDSEGVNDNTVAGNLFWGNGTGL